MGVPSIFLRTFGCNFTCGGFGMPKGKLSEERDTIAVNAENIKNYKDLPLVSTGCDSYASWDPRFKHLSPVRDIDYLACNIKPRCGAISFNNRVATMYCGSPCRRII